jgi:RNA polymerase sigma-70 factor (ECF subfamily)
MSEERELVKGIMKNDEHSFEKILNIYKGRIFSYILRLVKNYDDAEEMTFETFIRFFKSVNSYETSKSLSTWLFTIAHNLVIDHFRKNRIEYEYLDESHPAPTGYLQKRELEETSSKIEQALSKLTPVDREIVILFHKEEHSYHEISDILNLPVSTIKTRLHRARKKLRSFFAKTE